MKKKIGVLGASGKLGTLIVDRLVEQHAEVTAIVRHPDKVTQNVPVLQRSLFDLTAEDIQPFDVIISTFSAPNDDIEQTVTAVDHLTAIFDNGTTQLIFAGSVGPLLDEHQTRVAETELIQPEYRERGKLALTAYKHLESNKSFDWLYMAPPLFFDPEGAYTGAYEFTGQQLKYNAQGLSYVSYLDMAAAIVDKLTSEENHELVGVHS